MLTHRETTPVGVREFGGWPMKLYRITAERPGADTGPAWQLAAEQAAADVMVKQNHAQEPAAAGFVVLHHGEAGNWLLVHWWRGDILFQSLQLGRGEPPAFGAPPQHAMACLFELVVIDHERRAWARHVLGGRDDVAGYLHDTVAVTAGAAYC